MKLLDKCEEWVAEANLCVGCRWLRARLLEEGHDASANMLRECLGSRLAVRNHRRRCARLLAKKGART